MMGARMPSPVKHPTTGMYWYRKVVCGIRGKADSDSDARRPLIPTEAGQ